MVIKQIETPKVIVALRKDDILHIFYKKNTMLTAELQDEMIGYFNRLAGERKIPFIFEAHGNVGMSTEARNRATSLEPLMPVSCSVIYAQNFFIKLLGDFFLLIKRPKTPYMVFTDFQAAIDWLLKTHQKIKD
ncbi:MAG: hypothetical protein ACO1O6_02975 [Bacteroidota bacterium]